VHHEEARGVVFVTAHHELDVVSGTPIFSDIAGEADDTT
jgi:hypothetical protein